MDSPTFLPSLQRWEKFFEDMERQDGEWLAGNSYSLADIGYAPYMIRLEHLGLESLWQKRQRAAAWKKRLFERPGYKEGVEKWLNPKYLELFEAQRPAVRQRMSTM